MNKKLALYLKTLGILFVVYQIVGTIIYNDFGRPIEKIAESIDGKNVLLSFLAIVFVMLVITGMKTLINLIFKAFRIETGPDIEEPYPYYLA